MTTRPRVPFGAWILGDVLGLGGFAEVRQAWPAPDPPRSEASANAQGIDTSPSVVLKRLLPMLAGQHAALRAFEVERTALMRVQGPEIVKLISSGTTRGLPWLALERVHGVSLTRILRCGPLPMQEALLVLHDLAQALVTCHAGEVLHGDLAPGNVLVDRVGSVKLIDFGLATYPAGPPRMPGAGTPAFLDPDAALGQERRPESDLFGLVLLWIRMRSGLPPWGAGAAADQRRRAAAGALDPTSLTASMQGLPRELALTLHTILSTKNTAPDALAPDARTLATQIAALVSMARGSLRQRVCALPEEAAPLLEAAEDRGEQLTDPTGETVTLVGESSAVVELASDLD